MDVLNGTSSEAWGGQPHLSGSPGRAKIKLDLRMVTFPPSSFQLASPCTIPQGGWGKKPDYIVKAWHVPLWVGLLPLSLSVTSSQATFLGSSPFRGICATGPQAVFSATSDSTSGSPLTARGPMTSPSQACEPSHVSSPPRGLWQWYLGKGCFWRWHG